MTSLLAMFFSGPWEIIIVLVIILLLFGHRLPALMRSMGRGVVEFKKGVNDVDDDVADSKENARVEKKS